MKIRGSLFLVIGQLVLLSLSFAASVHDVPGALEYFKINSIPVEDIRTEGQTVIAVLRYEVDLRVAMARLEDHQGAIFKRLASDFPDSKMLRINCSVNGEPVCQLEMDTPVAVAALSGVISAEEMEARLRAESFVNFKERFSSLEAAQEKKLAELPRGERSGEQVALETAKKTAPETAEQDRSVAGATPLPSSGGGSASSPRQGPGLLVFIILFGSGSLFLAVLILLFRGKKRESSGLKIDAGLAVLYPDGRAEKFQIRRPRVTIGRDKGNSLVIADPEVSTRHAEIIISQEGFLLRDNDSANGTFVNGARIVRTMIYQGDEVRVGSTKLHLR
jgi:hypothetical protein